MARKILIIAALVVLTLVVYAKTIGYPFIARDDGTYIYQNPRMIQPALRHIPHYWTNSFHGLYIPVTGTAWTLIARVSGLALNYELSAQPTISPTLFHFANVALHLGSTLLLLLLLSLLFGRKNFIAAALGAAVFAIHPLQVESVAWVSGMKDTLSTFAALASILFYLLAATTTASARGISVSRAGYALSVAFYFAALLAKPTPLVAVPLVLLAIDRLIVATPWKKALLRVSPYLVASIVIAGVTLATQLGRPTLMPIESPLLLHRPLIALDSLAFYSAKLLYPVNLALDYGRTPEKGVAFAMHQPLWLLVLAAIAGVFFFGRKNRRFYLIGGAVVLGALIPVLGLIPFTYQDQSTVANRFMYLPLVGVALCIAAFLKDRSRAWSIGAGVAVLALTFLSAGQAKNWSSSEKLFTHSLEVNPDSAPMALNLGSVYLNLENHAKAITFFEKSASLRPDVPLAHQNLGLVYLTQGEYAKAKPYFEKTIELNPRAVRATVNLAMCVHQLGETERAVTLLHRALDLDPGSAEASLNLAIAYHKLGNQEEAARYFEEATRLSPGWPTPLSSAGAFYLRIGRIDDAVRSLERLVALTPGDPSSHALLAESYALNGRHSDAAMEGRAALEIARRVPAFPADRLKKLEQALERFEAAGGAPR